MLELDSTFTSESVCSGHPDKICDQISDAIVDEVLRHDPNGRVAVETLVTTNRVVLAGEVTCKEPIDFEALARKQIKRLGYVDPKFNFTDQAAVEVYIHAQSQEIAAGVDQEGAGDQGMMFGFACNETEQLMPMPIAITHSLTKHIDQAREMDILPFLHPDGKAQVTVGYIGGRPVSIESVVLAVPHAENVELSTVREKLIDKVIKPTLEEFKMEVEPENVVVNGTGTWHIGGPSADTGVTGRKIIVDSYGGYARVGGGAFSGKDPTKVDRSGAYAARFLAKNIVAEGLAEKAEVRLAYYIGGKKPVMQEIETFGTEKSSKGTIQSFANYLLDTSVAGIIDRFKLKRPIYLDTASYGHFGRLGFPWEEIIN